MSRSPITIGIAGGSGSGKTTLAKAIYNELGQQENVTYLVHDDYYKDLTHLSIEEREVTNFDHPDSLDTDLLIEHVKDLKEGKTVDVPKYDFTTHNRTSEVKVVESRPVILIEGILIFSDIRLVEQMDIKVYVDCDADMRLMRRIARDISVRGRTVDQVMKQYSKSVRPMHEEFVEPSKAAADVIVHTTGIEDRTSVARAMITNYLKERSGL
uniref:Uridine kinase n=1 Tax=Helicotheca tamesis TaxID=374047 RepID=A0A7S2MBI1_9STRA|mmetsp:Transcript_12982/g.17844  ORF Transcript_12982/g.17844 Transcript_12982/m.17844 type:complete len:212 (+) Transcript_12982:120-755(+)|eukprot:CAMPEP_0185730374 /NCGR_PEP_ID=MMETSP1171-20130828/9716_1 /TAXON_ID=374046 /ORGANISM="Helicotheca tamensis, Strain CCMP826" /LENGTH=211 /DNA_ID=CAMNT_0028399405 /DNA_START=24 /DNA_END=659 /DNA_ORIENTATION=+